MITTTVVLGLLMAVSTQAAKDDSYYIAGTGNPNVNEKMYWKDAENVFQDLSQFSTLYVEFHNCAWTWMMASEEDNDIDENDYWYMGKIPPMGANVAYSLYGSLKGESFSGCGADTFINSFYTNTGFTNFARSMNYAGLSGFSAYSYDDDSSSSYTASCGGGYGVGCDYSNGFAVHTYNSDECDPSEYSGVKDTMSSLNKAMKSATCIQIYDSSSYSGSPYGSPLELLAYSHSCFYQDFFSPDGVCPDPYGKLEYYQQQFYQGIQESKKQDPYIVSMRKEQYLEDIEEGKMMAFAGLILIAISLVSMFVEFVSWCCCSKKKFARKQVYDGHQEMTSRDEDFIVTKRSADPEDTDTEAACSSAASVEGGGYVTMGDTAGDIEAPPAAYTPPTDVEDFPTGYAPPSEPTQPVVDTPRDVVDEPQPGKEMQVNIADQDAPVTLYGPPGKIPVDDPEKMKRQRMQSSRKVGDEMFESEDDNDPKKVEIPSTEDKPAPAAPVVDVSPEAEEAKPEDTASDINPDAETPKIVEEAPAEADMVEIPNNEEEEAEAEIVPETNIDTPDQQDQENTQSKDNAAEGEEAKATAPEEEAEAEIVPETKIDTPDQQDQENTQSTDNAAEGEEAEATAPEEEAEAEVVPETKVDTPDQDQENTQSTDNAAEGEEAEATAPEEDTPKIETAPEQFTTATELQAPDVAVSGEATKETVISETGSSFDAMNDPVLSSRESDSEDEYEALPPKLETTTSVLSMESEVEVEVAVSPSQDAAAPTLNQTTSEIMSALAFEETKTIIEKSQSELMSEYFDVAEASASAIATEEIAEVKKASTVDELTSTISEVDEEESQEVPKSSSWFGW